VSFPTDQRIADKARKPLACLVAKPVENSRKAPASQVLARRRWSKKNGAVFKTAPSLQNSASRETTQ
jgi:hypothetical protein